MKRMIGTTWSLFLSMCLALGGCSGERGQTKVDDGESVVTEHRMVSVISKPSEDPPDAEETEETEESADAEGAGTAMALDEGRMGKVGVTRQQALEAAREAVPAGMLARSAGVVVSMDSSSFDSLLDAKNPGLVGGNLAGSADLGKEMAGGTGLGVMGAGQYGTIGHGSGTGQGYGVGARGRFANRGAYVSHQGYRENTESYKDYGKNPMVAAAADRLSTFAVDVDTASYTIARRKIREGQTVPASAVRVEEFVNYFRYQYPGPADQRPFAVHMDAAPSPFHAGRHLLRVGVQAKKLSISERKPANLVFLVDVSGSMDSPDKLPLAQRALRILVDNLRDHDTVSLVTYAGETKLVLEPTGLERKDDILSAIESLRPGGGTAMGSGIELAYRMAARNLRPATVSRVIVLSDGDANVGSTSHQDILATIQGQVKEGVTLSTVGFGMGNYKDERMEQLANRGNGNYYYIDGISQARRVFQEQLGGTLEVVAKDVKIQVDFDPEVVSKYRLIGYENRAVADRDFRNDRVDAGEIGAGHMVTAMYEIEFAGGPAAPPAVVRIRAKKPDGERAAEWMYAFDMDAMSQAFDRASADFRFATAVMGAAEILRKSEHAAGWRMSEVIDIAEAAAGEDSDRREFIELMRALSPKLALATGR